MSFMHKMDDWSVRHHPKWLVVLRVILGLSLFLKGFGFIQNSTEITGFFAATSFFSSASWLNTVVPWIHLLAGSFLIMGLYTRLWSLVMIPVLLGAVFLVNNEAGIMSGEANILFPLIILVLLIFFFVEGGGPLSLDNYFKNYRKNYRNK